MDKIFFQDQPIYTEGYTTGSGFFRLISTVLPNVYVVSGLILFLYLVFGGFMLLTAGSDSKQAESGQQALTNAAIGFAIIFVSYWIIQIIEIITGVPIVKGQ